MPHKAASLKDNRFKVFFSIALFVSAVIVLAVFLVLPLASRVRETRTKIIKNQKAVEAQERQIAEFQAAESKLAKIKDSVGDVLGLFPDREASVNLVEALESALSRSQVSGAALSITDKKEGDQAEERSQVNTAPVQPGPLNHIEELRPTRTVRPEAPVQPGPLNPIEGLPFTLKYNSEYRNFTDFMQFVEHLPFIIEIRDFDVKAESEQTNEGELVKTGFADGTIKGQFFIKHQ